jgi:cystathionine beta-lyase
MQRATITELIHHPYRAPAGFEAVPPAVHKASTVMFANTAALRARSWKSRAGYTYGLHGTPTTFVLEERIATLEGGRYCVLQPSGLAAITLANLALLKAGDEVLLPSNVYGPSKEQARSLLARLGIGHRLYDPMDMAAFGSMLACKPKVVWLEAPGSVTMEFPNLRELARLAKASGAIVILDNTWGAGIAFKAFEMAIDVSMQALTKYPSGGADVLMGSLVTNDEGLWHQLLHAHMLTGGGVAGNDAELVLRSLATIEVRYAAHDRSARELAAWLAGRSEVSAVLHPVLPGAPGHGHWASHCTAAAGLFSVLIDERFSSEQVDAFVDALELFRIGYSWGGPASLVVPYDLSTMREGAARPRGHLVRLSVGLEAVGDLRADLERALNLLR